MSKLIFHPRFVCHSSDPTASTTVFHCFLRLFLPRRFSFLFFFFFKTRAWPSYVLNQNPHVRHGWEKLIDKPPFSGTARWKSSCVALESAVCSGDGWSNGQMKVEGLECVFPLLLKIPLCKWARRGQKIAPVPLRSHSTRSPPCPGPLSMKLSVHTLSFFPPFLAVSLCFPLCGLMAYPGLLYQQGLCSQSGVCVLTNPGAN